MDIGVSTGFSYKTMPPLAKSTIADCKKISDTIELSCLSGVAGLADLTKDDLSGFKNISIHAPANTLVGLKDFEIRNIFDQIQAFCDRINVHTVVFHPNSIDDWSVFDGYTFPVAVENMDIKKSSGKKVEEIEKVIGNFKFVFDATHCFANDNTLKLAEDFLNTFKYRLCEVHVSGYVDYHEPIYKTGQTVILDTIKDLDVPIIIESTCANINELKKEHQYISNYLNS